MSVNGIDRFSGAGARCRMARKLRVEYPGAIYHVMNRTVDKPSVRRVPTTRFRKNNSVGGFLEFNDPQLRDGSSHIFIRTSQHTGHPHPVLSQPTTRPLRREPSTVLRDPGSPLPEREGSRLERLPEQVSEKNATTPHPTFGHPLPIGWGEGRGEGWFGNQFRQKV